MKDVLYFDYQATTPMDDSVLEAMLPYFGGRFGNPASPHLYGLQAEAAVEKARRAIALGLGVDATEIVFTSGATEANNLLIKGLAGSRRGGHVVSVVTEHKSVLAPLRALQRQGFSLTLLPVDARGLVDPGRLQDALRDDTVLVSTMYGNNETGSLHPIDAIASVAHARGIVLHCDATQAIGQLPVQPRALGIDLMTFSGHKIYGPKGIGVAYVNRQLRDDRLLQPLIEGGGQEGGLRGGTPNVPAIVGLQRAFELALSLLPTEPLRAARLRQAFLAELAGRVDFINNTPLDQALPHCVNLSFPGVNPQTLLQSLSGLAVSDGSACNSGAQQPSHVLTALGLPPALIGASLRLSFGRPTTHDDAVLAARLLALDVAACRQR